MTEFIRVPIERIEPETLDGLLQEFASRDGTDYGERETPLHERVAQLRRQLGASELQLLFHPETQSWDLVPREQARELLEDPASQESP